MNTIYKFHQIRGGRQMDIFERELAGEVIDPQIAPEFDKYLAVQRQSYELTHIEHFAVSRK